MCGLGVVSRYPSRTPLRCRVKNALKSTEMKTNLYYNTEAYAKASVGTVTVHSYGVIMTLLVENETWYLIQKQ